MLAFEHRHDFAFEVAAGQGIIGLQAFEPGQAQPLRDAEGLGDLPRRPVRNPGVADVPVLHQRVERQHRLLDRRRAIKAVDLIEIDVVQLQTLQARLARLDQMHSRGAGRVGPCPHRAEPLGRDHHVLPRHLEIAQRLAGHLLGNALGIDVGGVEEIDPGVERPADETLGVLLAETADLAPDLAAAAECHGAETEFRDE